MSSPLSLPDAPPELQPLIDQFQSEDPAVRSAAFEQLTDTGPPTIVRVVAATALADADAGVREEAARWLAEHATPDVAAAVAPQIRSDDITTRNLAGEVLVGMGACAVDALTPFVDDEHHDVRKFAVDVLAQIPAATSVVDVIAERLEDEDANVRLAAIAALGELGASEYADALREVYESDPLARPDVVTAMGAFGAEGDFALLERALVDDNPVVQLAAAEALASQDGPGVLDRLLRQVERVNPMARPIVLNSIIERCERVPESEVELPDTLEPHLQEMLGDPSDEYRCAAARGLRFFSTEQTVESMLAHAGQDDTLDVELFKTLMRHPDPFSPVHRAASANRMSAGAAATFTLGLLAQDAIAPAALQRAGLFLQRHFDHLSADDKMTAIGLCQQLDRPELQSVIEAAQSDPDPSIRAFAEDVAVPQP